jgi:hypothetical protein
MQSYRRSEALAAGTWRTVTDANAIFADVISTSAFCYRLGKIYLTNKIAFSNKTAYFGNKSLPRKRLV